LFALAVRFEFWAALAILFADGGATFYYKFLCPEELPRLEFNASCFI